MTQIRELNTLIGKQAFLMAIVACLLAACGQNYSDKPADAALAEKGLTPLKDNHGTAVPVVPATPAYGASESADGSKIWAGVATRVPDGWVSEKPTSSMRLAQYAIPAAHGGEGASLAVFAGNMGSVDDNVSRWIGQVSQPDGSDSVSKAKRWEAESDGGLAATFVDVSGTFSGGMGMGGDEEMADHRVLGAIVHTGSTFLYLKLTGPGVEVADVQKAFVQMVLNMRAG
ncbi:MAG: hypothetical protein O2782_14835 [bacterium]|nr:hypothetical protein [bacterium]